jgi:hypothetical protein
MLLRDLIAGAAQPVVFHIHFRHQTSLTFRADPPPVPVNSVVRGSDTRQFAIYVAQPVVFTPDAANRWTGAGIRMTATSANPNR